MDGYGRDEAEVLALRLEGGHASPHSSRDESPALVEDGSIPYPPIELEDVVAYLVYLRLKQTPHLLSLIYSLTIKRVPKASASF